jgi:alkylhydroperoxidase/carboxymuconolactone decarboxylase family protein YurZ
LRIALRNGVNKDEIADLFIRLEAYAGAARFRMRHGCSRRHPQRVLL